MSVRFHPASPCVCACEVWAWNCGKHIFMPYVSVYIYLIKYCGQYCVNLIQSWSFFRDEILGLFTLFWMYTNTYSVVRTTTPHAHTHTHAYCTHTRIHVSRDNRFDLHLPSKSKKRLGQEYFWFHLVPRGGLCTRPAGVFAGGDEVKRSKVLLLSHHVSGGRGEERQKILVCCLNSWLSAVFNFYAMSILEME